MVMGRIVNIAPDSLTTRYQEEPAYRAGLYDLEDDVFAWMVPNGSWGEANAGLVVGDGESLLIDTLWDVKCTSEMLEAMTPFTSNAPIRTVVNTHADGDHFWGNQLVSDADIITSQASYKEMLGVQPKSLILLGRVGQALRLLPFGDNAKVGHWFQAMVAPYDFGEVIHTPAKRTFEGQMSLSVGGRQVDLIEVGPAHTLGDLMAYVPETRVLFSGDILFIRSTPVMWAGPVENWLTALDRILAMDVRTIVPGHGPLTDKDGVSAVRHYWTYVVEKMGQCFQQGMSEVEAARDVVLSDEYAQQPFADWNSPERIMTNTHTLYRQWNGRSDHPKVPELLKIMRRQALLAHQLPDAQPQVMRR
jgi:cyclase